MDAMNSILMPSQASLASLCRRWQVTELAVFGSVARGAHRPDSDVDLLVTFQPNAPWSTLDLVELREQLVLLFGRQVDLVEEKAIRNPYRKASILHDKSVLYAA